MRLRQEKFPSKKNVLLVLETITQEASEAGEDNDDSAEKEQRLELPSEISGGGPQSQAKELHTQKETGAFWLSIKISESLRERIALNCEIGRASCRERV